MLKVLRVLVGSIFVGLIFYVASRAVRDCPTGPYAFENCLWLRLRGELRLPQSKLLRAAALEVVGLVLLAGLYATVRYVFPHRADRPAAPTSERGNGSDGPAPGSRAES